MRRGLRKLSDARLPAPGPEDEQVLRTPFEAIWARPLPGTDLVITYVVTPNSVDVLGVRPAWKEHR